MSFAIKPDAFEAVEKIYSADELYRKGLEASTPGLSDEQNLVEAHKWFNLAALEGNDLAREYRQQLTEQMSPREVAEAQRQARQYLAQRRAHISAL
ncbi:MAG: hypothetical protein ACWA5T_05495 [Parvularcula sp.]